MIIHYEAPLQSLHFNELLLTTVSLKMTGKKDHTDSILKTIGGLALAACFTIVGYCVLELSSLATKVEAQKVESESSINELKVKYEAEKPAVIQRIDTLEIRIDKLDSNIDTRFDRLENKLDTKMDTRFDRLEGKIDSFTKK